MHSPIERGPRDGSLCVQHDQTFPRKRSVMDGFGRLDLDKKALGRFNFFGRNLHVHIETKIGAVLPRSPPENSIEPVFDNILARLTYVVSALIITHQATFSWERRYLTQ
jgi:hypothetical protein